MRRVGTFHNPRRTSASALTKVGSILSYQAARQTQTPGPCQRWCAFSVTSENNPSVTGAILAMARSVHGCCVSTPRWAQTSVKVTSSCQRCTKYSRICIGVCRRSIYSWAWVENVPSGSRTRTQRTGRGGDRCDTKWRSENDLHLPVGLTVPAIQPNSLPACV